jgi:hypothetical protein
VSVERLPACDMYPLLQCKGSTLVVCRCRYNTVALGSEVADLVKILLIKVGHDDRGVCGLGLWVVVSG